MTLELPLALRFAVALGLGLLLGLERERSREGQEQFAGARTFTLVTLLGATAWHFQADLAQPALLWGAFAAVAALTVASYVASSRQGDLGATTEMGVLMAFLLGALCAGGQLRLATALAVATLLVFSIKGWSHRLAGRIEPADVEATLKFAILAAIVLPLLPDRAAGPPPLDALNPWKVGLMVVLISGLNFAAYVLAKTVGAEQGLGLAALLGGLVSSTAVTLGFSQRSRREPELAAPLALGILLAWTTMFFRVLVTVAVVNGALAERLAVGVGLLGALSLLACVWLWRRERSAARGEVRPGSNPFELGAAVKFGLLFGLVSVVARAAQLGFGAAGLYAAGFLAGLTDVDAISLSMAELARTDPASAGAAARTVLLAVLSNTLVKAGMAVGMGAPALRRSLLVPALALAAGGALALLLVG